MVSTDSTTQLWEILGLLRGDRGFMPDEIGPQLAALFYLRWADFQEAEREAIAAFDGTKYGYALPPSLHWRTWHAYKPEELADTLCRRLPQALSELGNARHNSLATYLYRMAAPLERFKEWSPDALATVVRWLANQPFETSTDRRLLLGQFDQVVFHLIEDKQSVVGEHFEPAWLAELVAALGRPATGERIYDPCFGAAGFLVAACDYVRANVEDGFHRNEAASLSISGVDINANAFVMGLARLALAGVDDPQLELGNSLECTATENPYAEGYDLVVANPPWGARMKAHGLDHYPIKTNDVTILFIQHVLAQLRPKGRAVIVVPQGFLFRGGADQRLRELLLRQHSVEAVVALPAQIFHPSNGIAGSVLVLRKEGPSRNIRMINGEGLFHAKRPGGISADDAALAGITAAKAALSGTRATKTALLGLGAAGLGAALTGGIIFPLLATTVGAGLLSSYAASKKGNASEALLQRESIKSLLKLVESTESTEQAWNVSVEDLQKIDWDLTPRRRDQSGLEAILEQLQESAPTVFLENCCDIMLGRSIRSADLLDEPLKGTWRLSATASDHLSDDDSSRNHPEASDADSIAYIRIGDIQKGVAEKGSKWLRPEAIQRLNPRCKLKAGDVLLSKSGTIGKVGLVRNGAVGAVPSSGLFVLRPKDERLDPHFLIAYLDSAECQAWLLARSRGTVMNHLSKKLLAELPIPLPPLQVQQRIAGKHREHGVDALDYLTQLLVEGERDPVIGWMDQALQHLKSEQAGKLQALEPLLHAQVFGSSFTDIRNELIQNTSKHALAKWVLTLDAMVVPALRDSEAVPPGTALYALLQQAERGLRHAADTIEGHTPQENRARDLTNLVSSHVGATLTTMLASPSISLSSEVTEIENEAAPEITVNIRNNGVLPLRRFSYRAFLENGGPEWDKAEVSFLPEGGAHKSTLTGTAPPGQDKLDFVFEWQATDMAGKEVQGSAGIGFAVKNAKQTEPYSDLAASPYICGDPITPKRGDVFVGREALLAQIRRQIAATGNVVLLEGNRRAGKTSILKHLDGPNGVPGWLGVYTSLQGAEGSKDGVGVPTDEVFRTLAREMAKSVHVLGGETPLPNGSTLPPGAKPFVIPKACREGISADAPFTDFQAYVEVLLDVLAERGFGLLLMLDEFDKLQEGIDHGVTSPQVPENIRFLVQTYPKFSAILTGSKRLKRLREEYWSALYGLGTRIGVTALDDEAAEQLITLPVRGRLTYAKEAIRRVIYLTAGQPFLLQCLCNRIYEQAVQLKTRSVTLDQVERASRALIEDNEHFASLWDYAGGEERPQLRRYLLALCHRAGGAATPLRLGVIQERLLADGIEVSDSGLAAALDHLRELELIDLIGDGIGAQYRLSIPLMGFWIDNQRDIAATLASAKIESEEHNA